MTDDNHSTDILQDLLKDGHEKPWLEFKENSHEAERIGKAISALSNSALLHDEPFGYLIWGVSDAGEIVGTSFNPDTEREGNQSFQAWLKQHIEPSIAFEFDVISTPAGRTVLLKVPAATQMPTVFDNIPYFRLGDATTSIIPHTAEYAQLLDKLRSVSWETGIAKERLTGEQVLELLDYKTYFKLIKIPPPDDPLETLLQEGLIQREPNQHWAITNMAAILFAHNLSDFGISIQRKEVRLCIYKGNDKAAPVSHSVDFAGGYAVEFENIIRNLTHYIPQGAVIEGARRRAVPSLPDVSVREIIANALIHQDFTITGAGPMIDLFTNRLEVSNPGKCLIEDIDRIIDAPPRSRNGRITALMRRMSFAEESGSGIKKAIRSIEKHHISPPRFEPYPQAMRVTLMMEKDFRNMTPDNRISACYQHAVMRWLAGDRLYNKTLCERFGLDPKKRAPQATAVINATIERERIKIAEHGSPRAGYIPIWA